MLARASGDGGDKQHFISILKRVGFTAEKADVLFVYIDVEKAADLARFVAQMRLELRELFVERA